VNRRKADITLAIISVSKKMQSILNLELQTGSALQTLKRDEMWERDYRRWNNSVGEAWATMDLRVGFCEVELENEDSPCQG